MDLMIDNGKQHGESYHFHKHKFPLWVSSEAGRALIDGRSPGRISKWLQLISDGYRFVSPIFIDISSIAINHQSSPTSVEALMNHA